MDIDAAHARVLFRAEGQGRLGSIHVGYIGGEAVALAHGTSGWEPEGGIWLPRLEGVLDALQSRDQALSQGDRGLLQALARDGGQLPAISHEARLPVRAWFVRIEGEGATVSEVTEGAPLGRKGEAQVDGVGSVMPTKRLELHRQSNGWRFTSGLL